MRRKVRWRKVNHGRGRRGKKEDTTFPILISFYIPILALLCAISMPPNQYVIKIETLPKLKLLSSIERTNFSFT